jgi:hypothetical protein
MAAQDEFRVAVLHQAAVTPLIGGALKPVKLDKSRDATLLIIISD